MLILNGLTQHLSVSHSLLRR